MVQAGTYTAQTPPDLIIAGLLAGNDMILELANHAQVRTGAFHAVDALLRLFRSASVKAWNDASVATGGTWTTVTSDGYSMGSAYQSTVPSSTITITTTETAIDLILLAQDDSKAGTTGSTFTVTVSGVNVPAPAKSITVDGAPWFIYGNVNPGSWTTGISSSASTTFSTSNHMKATGGIGSLPDYGFTQMCVALDNLGAGTKTIVITHTGASGNVLRFNGYLTRAATPPWIAHYLMPYVPAQAYYTGAPPEPSSGGASGYFSTRQMGEYDSMMTGLFNQFTDRTVIFDPKITNTVLTTPSSPFDPITNAAVAANFLADFVHMRDPIQPYISQRMLRAMWEKIP